MGSHAQAPYADIISAQQGTAVEELKARLRARLVSPARPRHDQQRRPHRPQPAASPFAFLRSPPYSLTCAMSEIRRKLVIVGDGACGKVISDPPLFILTLLALQFLTLLPADLSLDCIFKGNVP